MALSDPTSPAETRSLDVEAIRADFPILERRIHDQRLVFLDSAASSQKPRQVLAAMDDYYETHHANVHRAAYTLAEEATNAMEGGRAKVARFIGAAQPEEIVFTKNATESINLVARSWGAANLGPGDAVLLTLPGETWSSRATVRTSAPTPFNPLPAAYDAPPLSLREHRDVTCLPRRLMLVDGAVLPGSYRFHHRPKLRHPLLTRLSEYTVERPVVEGPVRELPGGATPALGDDR